MNQVQIDQPVADFELPATGGQHFRLSEQRGKNVVIYFYPKDNTPGCTLEGQQFRDNVDFFEQHNTIIVGVSRDSVRVHENFKAKHNFPFELLSDTDETVCKLFDVIKLKKNYGREYMGIERSTFLIDADGVLRQAWRKVKVKGHVDEVRQAVESL